MNKIKKVLFYVDAEVDDVLLETVIKSSEFLGSDLTIAAVVKPATSHVLLSGKSFDLEKIEHQKKENRQLQIAKVVASITFGNINVDSRVLVGNSVAAINKLIVEEGFDLLVKAQVEDESSQKRWFGCLDRQLMRTCPTPVVIGRPRVLTGAHKVVAALDYDADDEIKFRLNNKILDMAMLAAGGESRNVSIVHAWSLYGYSLLAHGRNKIPREELQDALDSELEMRRKWVETRLSAYRETMNISKSSDFQPKIKLVRGKVEMVIPQAVKEFEAELLCLGTVSRSGIKGGFIGNTSEGIIDKVGCSVAVLKPEDFMRQL